MCLSWRSFSVSIGVLCGSCNDIIGYGGVGGGGASS